MEKTYSSANNSRIFITTKDELPLPVSFESRNDEIKDLIELFTKRNLSPQDADEYMPKIPRISPLRTYSPIRFEAVTRYRYSRQKYKSNRIEISKITPRNNSCQASMRKLNKREKMNDLQPVKALCRKLKVKSGK